MANRKLISDLGPNELIDGIFALHNCQLGQTKTGKPFLKCMLGDRSARTPGRMWNVADDLFQQLPTDGFAWIDGQTQPYQGEMQIIIQQIRPVEPSQEDLLELLPSTERDVDEMFSEVCDRLRAIANVPLRALCQAYLSDEELMSHFCRAPAAMALHHAYIGGLLEHTLNMLNLAEVICPQYERLNRELVLVGVFLHDLGKCAELEWETGFRYSDEGQLVGHIARGVIWLQSKADHCAAEGMALPEPVLQVLHHIILSHHGTPEFGALKIPATPEAIIVSMIDNLDAKMHMALSATRWKAHEKDKENLLGGHFTEKIWALSTRMYRPDPTTLTS